jgi:hypothetical protein
MNRKVNKAESFAGNLVAADQQQLFFEVPLSQLVVSESERRHRATPRLVRREHPSNQTRRQVSL